MRFCWAQAIIMQCVKCCIGLQKPVDDSAVDGANKSTAEAALELCSLAPALLQTGNKKCTLLLHVCLTCTPNVGTATHAAGSVHSSLMLFAHQPIDSVACCACQTNHTGKSFSAHTTR